MFFLIRSAICIGLVVAALPDTRHDRAEPGLLSDLGHTSAQAVTVAAEQLCRSLPERCAPLIVKAVSAGVSSAAPVPAMRSRSARLSLDTLTEADRRPTWTGRTATAID